MHAKLQDLRFLHMATHLEEMFEGLEKAFERHIPEGAVRNTLRPIFQDGPAHRRLQEAYVRVNHEVAEASRDVRPLDLLEAILACEKAAQRFYADNAAHLLDPGLAKLFRDLAAEEGHHQALVQEALRLQRAVG